MRVFLILLLAFSITGCGANVNPTNSSNSNNRELSTEEKQRIDDLAKNFVEDKEVHKNLQLLADYDRSPEAILRNIEEADSQITYAHLKKNADKYIGKKWAFTGRILEISERGNETTARIGVGAYSVDAVWVYGKFTTDFVENQKVFVVGILNGDYTYVSQAGWKITIPAIIARAILDPNKVQSVKAVAVAYRKQGESRRKQQSEVIQLLSNTLTLLGNSKLASSQADETNYLNFIYKRMPEDANYTAEFGNLSDAFVRDPNIRSNSKWRDNINGTIDRWRDTSEMLIRSTPSARLIPVHRELLTAYKHFMTCGYIFEQYIEDRSDDKIAQAAAEIKEAASAARRATVLLNETGRK